ncbi:DUF4423 domain-containing protein [Bdellovibrio sp. 22V]|uniref:DUF4423 domain-containing protein n=1 Tax=Bdellovibrio TaxID=958 RepID=UPI002543C1BE|nr:DUF4423 domain-containing protein [Bdellovibrio sp. 22V]WII71701.1 DUF4423 domain-containing protein [Bdellovibrio sp. 22V]
MRKKFPQFLKNLLEERQSRNERYSKRAFAKHCGISIGQLNDYLTGRRVCSAKTAQKIILSLNLSEEQERQALKIINSNSNNLHSLEVEHFSIISDPAHFAFLALSTATDFVLDVDWIAQKLRLTEDKVEKILHNLTTVGLVEIHGEKLTIRHEHIITSLDVPSEALRRSHKTSLQRIINSMDDVPLEKREVCSVSVCIDPKKLPIAKKRILNFVEKTARFLESGDKKEVYEINVQLFPWS